MFIRRITLGLLAVVLASAMFAPPAGAQLNLGPADPQAPGPEGWQQLPATWAYCENFYDDPSGHVYWCYLENDQTWVRMRPDYWDLYNAVGPMG